MCSKQLVSKEPQTVVFLEDEVSLIKFYEDLLSSNKKINCKYFTTLNDDFITFINKNCVDLFVVDIVLGIEKNGIEIVEDIIGLNRGSIFLFISGYNYDLTSLDHLDGKCIYDFIKKPSDVDEFLVTIHTLLNIAKTYKQTHFQDNAIACRNIRDEYWQMIIEERKILKLFSE